MADDEPTIVLRGLRDEPSIVSDPSARPTIVLRDEPPIVSDASGRLPPEMQIHYEGWVASCERIWEASRDPLILAAAVRHASFYGQPYPSWLAAAVVEATKDQPILAAAIGHGQPYPLWLAVAVEEALIKARTPAQAKRYHEQLVRMQRWSRVKALRAQGMTWDAIKEAERTTYNYYAIVKNNIDNGLNKYWVLWDRTRRPHLG